MGLLVLDAERAAVCVCVCVCSSEVRFEEVYTAAGDVSGVELLM